MFKYNFILGGYMDNFFEASMAIQILPKMDKEQNLMIIDKVINHIK